MEAPISSAETIWKVQVHYRL